MTTATETAIFSVMETAMNDGDGAVFQEDMNAVFNILNLPAEKRILMFTKIVNLLEEAIECQVAIDDFKGDPQWAFDKYTEGERYRGAGHLDEIVSAYERTLTNNIKVIAGFKAFGIK